MAAEENAEEVVGLALLQVRRREHLGAGVDLRERVLARVGQQRLDPDPLGPVAVEQLVVDGEAGLRRQVVGRMDAGEEGVLLSRRVAQPAEHGEDLAGVDHERAPLLNECGVQDGAGVGLVDLRPDQLEARSVRHRAAPGR
jgi:hypothetical protein